MGQDSEYVELHGGSRAYIYGGGNHVKGFGSYAAFVDAICTHAENAGFSEAFCTDFQERLENHYDVERKTEYEDEMQVHGAKPEMAHVIAQHLDSRLPEMEYTEYSENKLRNYAESGFTDCETCGEPFRKDAYTPDAQGDNCHDCYTDYLKEMDVSADMSAALDYLENSIPESIAPTEEQDKEFFAICNEIVMAADGERRQALDLQVTDATDEVMDGEIEQRPVDRDMVRRILEELDE